MIHAQRRRAQGIGLLAQYGLLGNSAGKHAPRHLDPMSHRGKHFFAGVHGVYLSRENLATKIGKCLVRERLCTRRQSIRHANAGAGVQLGGVRIQERKRVRGALFT